MKKLLIAAIVLFLLFPIAKNYLYSRSQPEPDEIDWEESISDSPETDILYGTWYSDDEELFIYNNTIEITGYYEHDDQLLAGVMEQATITSVDEDAGTFTCTFNNEEMEGYLKDDDTLVFRNQEYKR